MLRNWKIHSALLLANAADSLMGTDRNTYASINTVDSAFKTREEISLIFKDLSDSLATSGDPSLRAKAKRISDKGIYFSRQESLIHEEWKKYYRTLPPDLRLKISR